MCDLRKFLVARKLFKQCFCALFNQSNGFTPFQPRVDFPMYGRNVFYQKIPSAAAVHTCSAARKEIGYPELQRLQKSGLTVIDVRERDEIKASGTVPGSLHIPLGQLDQALGKAAKDFKAKYGRRKPGEGEAVVFLCQRGARSRKAMEKAVRRGYTAALSYRGGWEDYQKNSK